MTTLLLQILFLRGNIEPCAPARCQQEVAMVLGCKKQDGGYEVLAGRLQLSCIIQCGEARATARTIR